MDTNLIVESLSPIERKLIPLLSGQPVSVDSISSEEFDKTSI